MMNAKTIEAAAIAMRAGDPQPTARLMRELSEMLLNESYNVSTTAGRARVDVPGEYTAIVSPMPGAGECDFLAELIAPGGTVRGGFTVYEKARAKALKMKLKI